MADVRLLKIAAIVVVVGSLCAVAAVILLKLIDLFTNCFTTAPFRSCTEFRRTTTWDGGLCLFQVAGGLSLG